jgi:hypothetical protein
MGVLPRKRSEQAWRDGKGIARRSFVLAEPPRWSGGRSMRALKASLATPLRVESDPRLARLSRPAYLASLALRSLAAFV